MTIYVEHSEERKRFFITKIIEKLSDNVWIVLDDKGNEGIWINVESISIDLDEAERLVKKYYKGKRIGNS